MIAIGNIESSRSLRSGKLKNDRIPSNPYLNFSIKKFLVYGALILTVSCNQANPKSENERDTTTNEKQQSSVDDEIEAEEAQVDSLQNKVISDSLTHKHEATHYICYNGDGNPTLTIWISFGEDGKALEVKYKGMDSSMTLVFKRESDNLNPNGPYPVYDTFYDEIVNGEVNGTYKLTHAGVWDYVEYVRGKDKKSFKFTVDHQANPYGKTPCFD